MKQMIIASALLLIVPLNAFAETDYVAGKIQGASYVFNKTVQPTSADDPKVALERDFVLQTTDGKAYFLPNVPRSMKVKAVNKDVRVYGQVKDDGTIFVHQISVKYGDQYILLCDWERKMKEQNWQ